MDETRIHTQAHRIADEQRFRASIVTSAAAHILTFVALVFAPMLFPRPIVMPHVVPVHLLPTASSAPPERAPEPEASEPEAEPEPVEPEPAPVESEPEPVPRSIEDVRREQEAERERIAAQQQREREAEAERQRLEAERRREDEAERRRREEEERLRLEEEARARPQSAGRRPDPERQTARRQGIDVTGTEENQTSFTVEDFPFAAYLQTIRDLVGARWNPPERGQFAPAMRAEVFFRIGRDGRLTVNARIVDASGNTIYDQAAMRAIAAAAPFPPLPREYAGTSLGVRFAFVQE